MTAATNLTVRATGDAGDASGGVLPRICPRMARPTAYNWIVGEKS
jgi:hypothetical protein